MFMHFLKSPKVILMLVDYYNRGAPHLMLPKVSFVANLKTLSLSSTKVWGKARR